MTTYRNFTEQELLNLEIHREDCKYVVYRDKPRCMNQNPIYSIVFRTPDDDKLYAIVGEDHGVCCHEAYKPVNDPHPIWCTPLYQAIEVKLQTRVVEIEEYVPVDDNYALRA